MLKKLFLISLGFVTCQSFGAINFDTMRETQTPEVLTQSAFEIFEATKIVCSGISDEISKVSNVSKANTAVTAVGTVAAGGALVAGVMKSAEEKEIDDYRKLLTTSGCSFRNFCSLSAHFFIHRCRKTA